MRTVGALGLAVALRCALLVIVALALLRPSPATAESAPQELANFMRQAAAINQRIRSLSIPEEYCKGSPVLADDQATLAQIQADYKALKKAYQTYRDALTQLAQKNPQLLGSKGFDISDPGKLPDNPNYFVTMNSRMAAPAQAIDAAAGKLAHAKVIDCSPPDTVDPPKPPEQIIDEIKKIPHPDPLAGLTMPSVPYFGSRPTRDTFCTEADRRKWIDAVIAPEINKIIAASAALRAYMDDVYGRLLAAQAALNTLPPVISNPDDPKSLAAYKAKLSEREQVIQNAAQDIPVLQKAFDDATKAHDELDAQYKILLDAEKATKVDPATCPQNSNGDPLLGLDRPKVETTDIAMPTRFCSQQAKDKFVAEADAAARSAFAAYMSVSAYYNAVSQRLGDLLAGKLKILGVTLDANDQNAQKALQDEQAWAAAEMSSLLALVHKLDKLRDDARRAEVVDCGPSKTTGGIGAGPGVAVPPPPKSCIENDPAVKAAQDAYERARADFVDAETDVPWGPVNEMEKLGWQIRLQTAKDAVNQAKAALNAAIEDAKRRCGETSRVGTEETQTTGGEKVGYARMFSVAVQVSGSSFTEHVNGTVTTSSVFPGSTDISGASGLVSLDLRAQVPIAQTGFAFLGGATVGDYFNSSSSGFQPHPKINNTISVTKEWETTFYAGVSTIIPNSSITASLYGGLNLQFVNISQTADQTPFGAGVVNFAQDAAVARPMIGADFELPVTTGSLPIFVRAGAEVVFPGTASMSFTTPIPAAATGMGNYVTTVNFDTEVRAKIAVGIRF